MSDNKPTKKEQIKALIDAGFSMEEVVEKNIAKPSYVKSMFTQFAKEKIEDMEVVKLGEDPEAMETPKIIIDPQDISEDGPDLPEGAVISMIGGKVIEGFAEGDLVEVKKEDIPEEAEIKDEPLEIKTVEDTLQKHYDSCKECLERIEMKNIPRITQAKCQRYINLAKQVLVTKDLRGERLQSLNAIYNYIIPRPAGRSETVKVLALHREMQKLFRAHYNK